MDPQRIRVMARIIGLIVIVVLFWFLHLMYRQMQIIQREKGIQGNGRPAATRPEKRKPFGPRQIEVKPYEPPPPVEETGAGAEEGEAEEGASPGKEESEGGGTGG
jgi:hypothetical protein